MITTSNNFIQEFHNIQGDRTAIRAHNLFKLLRTSRLPPDELQLLAQNLEPKNCLERVFHADVLIHFKITDALYELCKEGQEVYVCKIIKHPWFFEEVFKNVSSNQLVEEVLPKLSYSVKVKLLREVLPILSQKQVDEVFDILLTK